MISPAEVAAKMSPEERQRLSRVRNIGIAVRHIATESTIHSRDSTITDSPLVF